MRYPIALHTDDNIRYGVTVPDMPGCFSSGESIDHAIESVKEAIDLHAKGLNEEGLEFPLARAINEHQHNPDYAGAIWAMVDVDLSRYHGKAEKTLPTRVNAYTRKKTKAAPDKKRGRPELPEVLRRTGRLSMRTFADVALKAGILGTVTIEALIRGAKLPSARK